MKKRTLIAISGIISLLLIAGIFAQGMKDRDRDQLRERIHDRLNFTDEQQTKIDDLRLKHQKEMIDLKAEVKKKELELKELMNDGNYTREEYLDKTNEIITARNNLALARANHKMDVYELLDADQKADWNKMGMRMHDRMGDGPGDFPRHFKKFRHNRNCDIE
jgi:Spy/CpxP family protein refolding chaperone